MSPSMHPDSVAPLRRKTLMLEWGGVSLLFAVLTLWQTNPLWRHPGTFLADPGDSLGNVSISWWLSRHFLSGRILGLWELPPYFYPAPRPITFNDPQIGTTLLSLPVYAATGNILAAFNFVTLLSLPLCALGAYALARHVTGSRAGALLAGLVWGFGLWHQGHFGHQQLLSLECLPFLLLALHRYGETSKGRFLVAIFGLWLAQEYLAEYWGMFLVLLIAPFAFLLLRVTYGMVWRDVARAGAAIGLAVVAWLPVQAAFLQSSAHGVHHSLHAIAIWGADLLDYLPPPGTWLWGSWGWKHISRAFPVPTGGEFWVSPGIIVLVLAGTATAGLWKKSAAETRPAARQQGQAQASWMHTSRIVAGLVGLVALVACVWLKKSNLLVSFGIMAYVLIRLLIWIGILGLSWTAIGPRLTTWIRQARPRLSDTRTPLLPYVALAALAIVWSFGLLVSVGGIPVAPGIHGLLTWLPGTRSFRVMVRMGVFADLALAVLAAAGLAALRRRISFGWTRTAVVYAVCGLALAENTLRTPLFSSSHDVLPAPRAADAWLAAQPAGAVVEMPLTGTYLEVGRMWHQTTFQKPMRNGIGTFLPLDMKQDVQTLQTPASAAAVARLHALGIRYVLLDIRQPWMPGSLDDRSSLPHLPSVLPPPYILRFTDKDVLVYELPPP